MKSAPVVCRSTHTEQFVAFPPRGQHLLADGTSVCSRAVTLSMEVLNWNINFAFSDDAQHLKLQTVVCNCGNGTCHGVIFNQPDRMSNNNPVTILTRIKAVSIFTAFVGIYCSIVNRSVRKVSRTFIVVLLETVTNFPAVSVNSC